MAKINDIIDCIKVMAPEGLAELWDNCGLIVDSGNAITERVVACLDVTQSVVETAISLNAKLIISHHPLIYSPIKSISRGDWQGALLYALIRNDISLYSAHTNVDKTYGGLNDLLAGLIGVELPEYNGAGAPLSCYRIGDLPREFSIGEFNAYVSTRLKLDELIVSSGTPGGKPIKRVAVVCGSYSLDTCLVTEAGADALLCGEIKHHAALELAANGVHVVQAGHHGTERFFINLVEKWVNDRLPDVPVEGAGFYQQPSKFFIMPK